MKSWLKGMLFGAVVGFIVRFVVIILLIPLGILAYARGWEGEFITKIFESPAFPFITYCSGLDIPLSIACVHWFALLNFV